MEDFFKMEACGNSFMLVADLNPPYKDWQAVSPTLLDRNFGVGADGLLVLRPSLQADFEVEMYNQDGSAMGMCGNGIRCVARLVKLLGLSSRDDTKLSFRVGGREIRCRLDPYSETVLVDMGTPDFERSHIPVCLPGDRLVEELECDGYKLEASFVSMGNPHCVIFCEDLDQNTCAELGRILEHLPIFPERTNVGFCQVTSANRITARVWERGVGLTMACGTGACAAVVVGARRGLCERNCEVVLPGGSLQIQWSSDDRVHLSGPAREIFCGKLSPGFLARIL